VGLIRCNQKKQYQACYLQHSGDQNAARNLLYDVADTNTSSLTILAITVTLPNLQLPNAVIQVIYDAPYNGINYVYYQCSDIAIVSPGKVDPPSSAGLVIGLIFAFLFVIGASIFGTRYYYTRVYKAI